MLDLTDWQNKKYQTRDGRPVRLLCIDAVGAWPIIGTLTTVDTTTGKPLEHPLVWGINGGRGDFDSSLDLINAKTKKEGWVNIWKNSVGVYVYTGQSIYSTEERARSVLRYGAKSLACVKIEWEE